MEDSPAWTTLCAAGSPCATPTSPSAASNAISGSSRSLPGPNGRGRPSRWPSDWASRGAPSNATSSGSVSPGCPSRLGTDRPGGAVIDARPGLRRFEMSVTEVAALLASMVALGPSATDAASSATATLVAALIGPTLTGRPRRGSRPQHPLRRRAPSANSAAARRRGAEMVAWTTKTRWTRTRPRSCGSPRRCCHRSPRCRCARRAAPVPAARR